MGQHADQVPDSAPARRQAAAERDRSAASRRGEQAAAIERSPRSGAQRAWVQTLQRAPAMQRQRQQLDDAVGPAADGRGGLPDGLRSGIESLSGVSMDGVAVHYDSPEPARVNALAYAQGRDIHLGPGQERELPHEAWHVVQQAQGRVAPTRQLRGGAPVNDDPRLELEADAMGAQAAQLRSAAAGAATRSVGSGASPPMQLKTQVPVWGGVFEDEIYREDNGPDSRGASMLLLFRPKPSLGKEDDTVSLVQTVKDTTRLMSGTQDMTPLATTSLLHERKLAAGAGVSAAQAGTAIDQEVLSDPDQGPQRAINVDPRYSERRMSATEELKTRAGDGSSVRSTRRAKDAWPGEAALSDQPALTVRHKDAQADAKTEYQLTGSMEFEVAALHNESGSYVGSVKWGWTAVANQAVLTPKQIEKADHGNASATLMKAAELWNAWKVKDPTTKQEFETLKLPTAGVERVEAKAPELKWKLEEIAQGYLRVYAPEGVKPEDIPAPLHEIQKQLGEGAELKDGPLGGPYTAFEYPPDQQDAAEELLAKLNGN